MNNTANLQSKSQLLPSPNHLQGILNQEDKSPDPSKRLTIANYQLPSILEEKGIFCFGSPGSGKSLTIAQIIKQLKQREDYRFVILDRNGEFQNQFYAEQEDLSFNPSQEDGIGWSHSRESASPEAIASALIPSGGGDAFWHTSARNFLADVLSIAQNTVEVDSLLNRVPLENLKEILQGKCSSRFFHSERMAGSIICTATAQTRFYQFLANSKQTINFTAWAKGEDPRNLFLLLYEDEAEIFQPLYSMAFNLIIKGLLSNQKRSIKTAIIIDELGALDRIPLLARLCAEGRKFKANPILATQTTAQLDKVYGKCDREILLQSIATKLILNCRDYRTANTMAEIIGKTRGKFTISPGKIQNLPPLSGYLKIAHHPVTEAQLIP